LSFKFYTTGTYEGVSKSIRTGRLEGELRVVQLSATRCSIIAILWVSLVSFAAITLCVASQWVFIFVYFVIDAVRKLLDTPSYSMLTGSSCRGWTKWKLAANILNRHSRTADKR
jgi:hypothetical protein